jgi:transcriptional regulator with XRE-family HTH domain
VGRKAGKPKPIPDLEYLLSHGLSRVRAQLAVRVATHRCARALTQSQLASRAGMNLELVKGIENGSRNPQFETVVRIANALNLEALDELLGPTPLEAIRAHSVGR